MLQALGARHIEVRSAWGVNIVDLDDDAARAAPAGARPSARWGCRRSRRRSARSTSRSRSSTRCERLGRAIAAARALGSRYIRLFSFYRGEGVPVESIRDDVMVRMRALADAAEAADVVLLHENEKDIYGDTPERCLDIVETVGSDHLRLAWDSANFVQVGVARPFDDGYATAATAPRVPAGEGRAAARPARSRRPARATAQLLETLTALRDDGYTGFASLEPHLTDVQRPRRLLRTGGVRPCRPRAPPPHRPDRSEARMSERTPAHRPPDPSAPLAVAIVGCGIIGLNHARAIARHPR